MIRSENGNVHFRGSMAELCAEVTSLLHDFFEFLTKEKGEEKAKELFQMIVEDAQKTPEKLEAELDELLRERCGEFGGLLAEILRKVGKDAKTN